MISFPSLAHGGLGSHVALCSGSWWPLFHFNLHSCLWLMVATTGLKYIKYSYLNDRLYIIVLN